MIFIRLSPSHMSVPHIIAHRSMYSQRRKKSIFPIHLHSGILLLYYSLDNFILCWHIWFVKNPNTIGAIGTEPLGFTVAFLTHNPHLTVPPITPLTPPYTHWTFHLTHPVTFPCTSQTHTELLHLIQHAELFLVTHTLNFLCHIYTHWTFLL